MDGAVDNGNNQVAPERGENVYTSDTVNSLSIGVLQTYKPSLEKTQKQLKDLCEKQTIIVEQLHDENIKIAKVQHSEDLQDIFTMIRISTMKLQEIKKDMKKVHERVQKITRTAKHLQQQREKELYLKNQKKEMLLKLEQELVAKHTE